MLPVRLLYTVFIMLRYVPFYDKQVLNYVKSTGKTQRDGMGREVGGGFGMGGHMYTHGWFMSMNGKNHHNTVISLQLK